MSFMQLCMTPKGALYSADCNKCGCTIWVHEWATPDNNGDRDALQAGTYRCPDCPGKADPDTFIDHGRKHYAARFSADGYMDCTDWHYGTNRRVLIREVKELYGDES